jgi:hypothetical protein
MHWDITLYSAALLGSAGMASVLALLIWHRRHVGISASTIVPVSEPVSTVK